MRNAKIIHPTTGCRHAPVGRNTRLINRFRHWFIFSDHTMRSYSYTVGMVKCTKCGALIRIPDSYYSFPLNLLYMVCCALLVWSETELLIASDFRNKMLLFFCAIVLLLLTYLLVDCVFWFITMHIGKWYAVIIQPEEHKIFVQRESKRFADDRQIKRIMWFLGTGLGSCLAGTPQKWYMFYLCGLAIGLVILVSTRTIKKRRDKKCETKTALDSAT